MPSKVHNHLAAIRHSRGIGASDLARRIGISRQTIHAIEAGAYVPNTEVTLRLARELEVSVEDLFSLETELPESPEILPTEFLSSGPPAKGQPVRICQIGDRFFSVPSSAAPYYLPESDAVVTRSRSSKKADLTVFSNDDTFHRRLILAGCDPATSLLARMVEKITGVEIVSAAASSKLAVQWLKEGKAHIAGSHLEDPETGEFNIPYLRQQFPDGDITVITFARWEAGLVLPKSNPQGIHKIEDLTQQSVRFINREPGSGARALLDRLLQQSGIPSAGIPGYDRIAYGHLAAAYAVLSGDASACLATRSAAQTFHLDFIPLHSERYDLVLRKQTLELPAAQAFLDVLQRAALRRKLEVLAGYDTAHTGAILG